MENLGPEPLDQKRIETIRENVNVENWGFVPTSLNPADICTRECSVGKLKVACCGERDQIFVWREGNMAITRVLVAKKCRFRGKGKQGGCL